MDNLAHHLTLVKEQEAYHDKLGRKFSDVPWRQSLHEKTAARFRELANFLVQSQQTGDLRQRQNLDGLALTPEDVEGLPPELVRELSISDTDKLEFTVLGILREGGGVLNLDRILIALYRKTGEVFKRNTTTSKLYRMIQKGLIFPVSGRKGVYSIEEIDAAQQTDLLSPVVNSEFNAASTPPTPATPDGLVPLP